MSDIKYNGGISELIYTSDKDNRLALYPFSLAQTCFTKTNKDVEAVLQDHEDTVTSFKNEYNQKISELEEKDEGLTNQIQKEIEDRQSAISTVQDTLQANIESAAAAAAEANGQLESDYKEANAALSDAISALEKDYKDADTTLTGLITDLEMDYVTADNELETKIAEKLNSNKPIGTGYFAMNVDEGVIPEIGAHSFSANRSIATGQMAAAFGWDGDASGIASFCEGIVCTASGAYSHAEGEGTTASVKGEAQHAQGKYNIIDEEGKYAHIVGNGASNARSNAHTLDWQGNAWFAGNIEPEEGIILHSPSGYKFKLIVDDEGNLSTTKIEEETE